VVGTERNFLLGGCFERTADTETRAFRAGSYSGYNLWRADLQAQFNPQCAPERPFYELIFFADNEGVIGPEAAADLLKDFEDHGTSYQTVHANWRGVYDDFTEAFRLAADDGLVDFH
jgi:hypothetical protein